jgi:hypothetical protein
VIEKKFIQYIGDYRVHDGVIEDIFENNQSIEVVLRSIDQELLKVIFKDVKEVRQNKAKGMMLYSVSEMSEEQPFRQFVFTNWDDYGDAYLEVVAKSYEMQEIV